MNLARAADRRARVLVGARAPFRAPADSVDYAPLELARLELTGTTSLDRPAPPPRDSSTEPTTESRLLLWTKSSTRFAWKAALAEHRRIVHEACAAERRIEVDTQLSGSLSLSAVSSTRPLVANVAFCRVLC